jgi:hypothetical protein
LDKRIEHWETEQVFLSCSSVLFYSLILLFLHLLSASNRLRSFTPDLRQRRSSELTSDWFFISSRVIPARKGDRIY